MRPFPRIIFSYVFAAVAVSVCADDLDNPDPGANQLGDVTFSQGVPAGSAMDRPFKLPGRDTWVMYPDRTGLIRLGVDVTHTYSTPPVVRLIDAYGVIIHTFAGVSGSFEEDPTNPNYAWADYHPGAALSIYNISGSKHEVKIPDGSIQQLNRIHMQVNLSKGCVTIKNNPNVHNEPNPNPAGKEGNTDYRSPHVNVIGDVIMKEQGNILLSIQSVESCDK